MLIEERSAEDFFFGLPPQTAKKKLTNFWQCSFASADCSYEDFSNYSVKSHTFYPQHLDSRFPEEREVAREIVSNYLKYIAEISNSNLIQNTNSLMAKGEVKIDPDVDFSWTGEIHPQSQTKFNVGY